MDTSRIRNFVIIAHIDHGKSTLADRFLELTGTIETRKMRAQYLDQMDLEREKGITIKMQPVRMVWRPPNHAESLSSKPESLNKFQSQSSKNSLEIRDSKLELANSKQEFVLNLIDTPGHADFGYEVSRALAAVEGAILLVDATQGVQAQTISNLHLAQAQGLAIIPVVNKIDLSGARVEETRDELAAVVGCERSLILDISGKTGAGVPELLRAVIERIPPPAMGDGAPRALIFDSQFDPYRGVIAHVRVFDGAFSAGDAIRAVATKQGAEVMEIGYFSPGFTVSG
ncbi:MAG: GTP-binding protein, partial [bacterium]|nr:GTP-binding protein [bacterium]